MKILVCLKRVIDYAVHIRVKADGSGVESENVNMNMNPFDAIALEEAVRLKENAIAREVIAVSIGSAHVQETLRQALALGADRAVLIQTEKILEPLHIAGLLKIIILKEKPDIILLGKQAIDDDCNQTGQMLAGLLNWPQAVFISNLWVNPDKKSVIVNREIDGGLETLELMLPAVITVDLRLNEPRYASLPNIMKARQKSLEIILLEQLELPGDFLKPHLEIIHTFSPPERSKGKILKSTDELIAVIKQSGGVRHE